MSSVSVFINTFPSTSTKGVLSVSVFIKTFPSTSTKGVKSGSVYGSTLGVTTTTSESLSDSSSSLIKRSGLICCKVSKHSL